MKYCCSYNIDAAPCDCGSSNVEHLEVVKNVEDKRKEGFGNLVETEAEAGKYEPIKEGERRVEDVRAEDVYKHDQNKEDEESPRDDPASIEGSTEDLGGEFKTSYGDPSAAEQNHPTPDRNRPHEGPVQVYDFR